MLTDAQCRGAKGKSKAYKITDADGLFLYVTPSGYRSWRYRYRFSGKQRQVVLGSYPDITLREARDLRDEQKRVLRSGNDPANEARRQAMIAEASAAHTFEIVARQWHQGQVARWKPVHAKDVIESLERDIFPEIGSLPLASIDAPLLLATIEPVQKRGAIETGHRLRQRISAVFQFGIAKGLIQIDPAASIGAAMTVKPVGRRWPAVTTIEAVRPRSADRRLGPLAVRLLLAKFI